MKNADKLLKLQVDLGETKRQIISGIAQYYEPSELIGKKVICVTNLKPVKLRGELSEGMILSGEGPDGSLSLATTDAVLPNGSVVVLNTKIRSNSVESENIYNLIGCRCRILA